LADLRIEATEFESDRELIFAIRTAVFVLEQSVPVDIEIDGQDPLARHVLAYLDGRPVGTGRILPDGRIGRMAVLREARGQGVGTAMLARLLEIARDLAIDQVCLSAQCEAVPFYTRLGFTATGPVYREAGIDHRWMERALDRR
jgi:predicted GNAT family N-acyltransferase